MTRSEPLFSIIIPTYNRALKVARAIESVLSQTFTDYDIWVIDDGSIDQTAQHLKPYLDRIHYLFQENGGVASARNLGVQQSSGRYVAFLDSDDRWYPHKLAIISAMIQTHPEIGLFYSQCVVVDETGESLWVNKSKAAYNNTYLALLMRDFITLSSAVVRRDCLEYVGKFDTTMVPCEDWDLWLRIVIKYPIYLVPEILVLYEHSDQSKLTSNTLNWLNAHDRVIEKAFTRDPTLKQNIRQMVLANMAYAKGRIWLNAKEDREALRWLNQAIFLKPIFLKAHLYRILLTVPKLRSLLPRSVLHWLHLPIP